MRRVLLPLILLTLALAGPAHAGPPCPGDINETGNIDVDDLVMVMVAWGACDGCPEDVSRPDFLAEPDGVVDINDLLFVILVWGTDGCACP